MDQTQAAEVPSITASYRRQRSRAYGSESVRSSAAATTEARLFLNSSSRMTPDRMNSVFYNLHLWRSVLPAVLL